MNNLLPIIVLILRVLMVVALYGFLTWMMITIWNDLKFHSQILGQKKIPQIILSTEGDPEADKRAFTQNEVIIGREETCDVFIPDPVISSRHARLVYRNTHWWIEDLMSTNGTYLNDERVGSPAILINGDELRIGKTILMVEIQVLN
ncbi:FHA domain-containing protein [bacterium]|nr:FHA domain-containing protein [bacterium]